MSATSPAITTQPAAPARFPRAEVATHAAAIARALDAWCQTGPEVTCGEYLALLELGEGLDQLRGALQRLDQPELAGWRARLAASPAGGYRVDGLGLDGPGLEIRPFGAS
jgi:hypothetical protein